MPTDATQDEAVSSAAERGWRVLPPSYAMPARRPSLAEAELYCRELTRSHYENFAVASWFLPKRLRQHFFNVYAYCRISDDLGDEVGDAQASLALFAEWGRGVGPLLWRQSHASGVCGAGGDGARVRHSQA